MNQPNIKIFPFICLMALPTILFSWIAWKVFTPKQPVNQIVASNTFPEVQFWVVEQGIVMKTNLLKCPHCGQWIIKP